MVELTIIYKKSIVVVSILVVLSSILVATSSTTWSVEGEDLVGDTTDVKLPTTIGSGESFDIVWGEMVFDLEESIIRAEMKTASPPPSGIALWYVVEWDLIIQYSTGSSSATRYTLALVFYYSEETGASLVEGGLVVRIPPRGSLHYKVDSVTLEDSIIKTSIEIPRELLPDISKPFNWSYYLLIQVNDGDAPGAPAKLLVLDDYEVIGSNEPEGVETLSETKPRETTEAEIPITDNTNTTTVEQDTLRTPTTSTSYSQYNLEKKYLVVGIALALIATTTLLILKLLGRI